jgi:hydroxymethylglutaryl-CoA lyase
VKVRGAVSCALGCPYQGEVSADEVERVVALMKGIGVDHCGVADTIGTGTPRAAQAALERALKHYPAGRGQRSFPRHLRPGAGQHPGLPGAGHRRFDTSIAGLGGCPYAKGATGNVATEDVVFMLHGMGIETGIDLDRTGRRRGLSSRACWAGRR